MKYLIIYFSEVKFDEILSKEIPLQIVIYSVSRFTKIFMWSFCVVFVAVISSMMKLCRWNSSLIVHGRQSQIEICQ